MEPFGRLEAVAVPIDLPNVDTDRIIPARFLRHAPGPGYERYLFHDVRFDDEGRERPDFVLNQAPYRGARIVVAAENFACGSSREAAVWALAANGFRACVAPSFGDIFSENCAKNGVLAVVLAADVCAELRRQLRERPGATLVVDLPAQTITGPDGDAPCLRGRRFSQGVPAARPGRDRADSQLRARHRRLRGAPGGGVALAGRRRVRPARALENGESVSSSLRSCWAGRASGPHRRYRRGHH